MTTVVTPVVTPKVLVLNASYEPLHHVTVPHAIGMIVRQVAVVEETHETMFGGGRMPKVLRLIRYVTMAWRYRKNMRCTKAGVLIRDNRTCAYCGGHAVTVDHVIPRSKGGPLSWENSVAACHKCNGRKAARTPAEANMPLRFIPTAPAPGDTYQVGGRS